MRTIRRYHGLINGIYNRYTMRNFSGSSIIILGAFIGLFGEIDYGGPITKSVDMFHMEDLLYCL